MGPRSVPPGAQTEAVNRRSVTLDAATRADQDECRFATLATIAEGGTPRLTVMWYLRRGDTIVFNTEAGRRRARNPCPDQWIVLCVEDSYRSVSLNGTVQIDDDRGVARVGIRELTARYAESGTEAAFYDRNFRDYERISYTLAVDRIRASSLLA